MQRWAASHRENESDAVLLERFLQRRDESAFAALVARHGAMVLRSCQRVLGDVHEAEDAFQATFLILARKAHTLKNSHALPGWLHSVARQAALKARAKSTRGGPTPLIDPLADPRPDPLAQLTARELLQVLDEEIAHLPARQRSAVLLCCLEGCTREEAARTLGCTAGSLKGHLERGRRRLQVRLIRRGITLPAALAVAMVSRSEASAMLQQNAVRAALDGGIGGASAALAQSVLRAMGWSRFAGISALVMTTALTASLALILPMRSASPPSPPLPAAPAAAKKAMPRTDLMGDPLPEGAIARLGTNRFHADVAIWDLSFTDGGKTIVAGARGFQCFIDAASGKIISHGPEPKYKEMHALSPDGKMFASEEWKNIIELRDADSGRLLHTLKGHTDKIRSIVFSADSKMLASGSEDKSIRLWDTTTGKPLRQIKHNQRVGKIAFSPDGKILASIDMRKVVSEGGGGYWLPRNIIHLWDTTSGKELRQLAMPVHETMPLDPAGFSCLRFSSDGKMLATGGFDGVVRLWDPATGKELRRFPGFSFSLCAIGFAPDGKTLAVAEGNAVIRLLRLSDGKDVVNYIGHQDRITSIRVMPDCQIVVTLSADGTVRFWDALTGRERRRRAIESYYPRFTQFAADGRAYITAERDRTYRLHDLESGKELTVLRGPQALFPCVLSPDRKTLASADAKNMVRLIDPATGAVRRTLMKVKAYVSGMAFAADGRTLVVWDGHRIATVWDVASGKKRRQFNLPAERLGPMSSGIQTLPYAAALSSDGRLLAVCLQPYDAEHVKLPIFDTGSGKEIAHFITDKDSAETMAFSPDGKSLAWAGWRNGTIIHIGEIATGRERLQFKGHRESIRVLTFSPDGKMLISGSRDTTALVWDLTGRIASARQNDKPLSAEDLKRRWDALGGEDAAAAYRSMQALAADPAHSVPFLHPRLQPVAAVDEERLNRLIDDLDNEKFAVREKAAAELEKLDEAAIHAMRRAVEDRPSLETRRRVEQLIDKQDRQSWPASAEQRRVGRALEVLECIGTAEARRVLAKLAAGAPGAARTREAKAALTRLQLAHKSEPRSPG